MSDFIWKFCGEGEGSISTYDPAIHKHHNERWTGTQSHDLVVFFIRGYTLKELCKVMGRTNVSIVKKLQAYAKIKYEVGPRQNEYTSEYPRREADEQDWLNKHLFNQPHIDQDQALELLKLGWSSLKAQVYALYEKANMPKPIAAPNPYITYEDVTVIKYLDGRMTLNGVEYSEVIAVGNAKINFVYEVKSDTLEKENEMLNNKATGIVTRMILVDGVDASTLAFDQMTAKIIQVKDNIADLENIDVGSTAIAKRIAERKADLAALVALLDSDGTQTEAKAE